MTSLFSQHRQHRFERGFTNLELAMAVSILVVLASILLVKVDDVRDKADSTAGQATMMTVRDAFIGSTAGPGYVADMKRLPGFDFTSVLGRGTPVQMQDLFDASLYLPGSAVAYDPVAQRGWRGPYLTNMQPVRNTNAARNGKFPAPNEVRFNGDLTFLDRHFYDPSMISFYGVQDQPTAADPWGNPIVVQVPPDSAFARPTSAKRFRYARIVSAGPDGRLDTPLTDTALTALGRLAGMLSDGTTAARGDDIVIFLNRADVYEIEEP